MPRTSPGTCARHNAEYVRQRSGYRCLQCVADAHRRRWERPGALEAERQRSRARSGNDERVGAAAAATLLRRLGMAVRDHAADPRLDDAAFRRMLRDMLATAALGGKQ